MGPRLRGDDDVWIPCFIIFPFPSAVTSPLNSGRPSSDAETFFNFLLIKRERSAERRDLGSAAAGAMFANTAGPAA